MGNYGDYESYAGLRERWLCNVKISMKSRYQAMEAFWDDTLFYGTLAVM